MSCRVCATCKRTQRNMGFFKKLKCWRRRDRSQKHSEKHRENLEEGDTNTVQVLRSQVAEMQKLLEQKDREEANLRGCISDYEKTLEEVCLQNQAETESNLFGLEKKLKVEDTEMDQMVATYCANISVLEKELEEAKFFKSEAENKMCGLENRLKEKDRGMCQMEAAYREKIIMLEKKLEEQFLKNETEANLHGLEKPSKEKDSERDKIEGTYRDKIIGLEKKLEQAQCMKNEIEAKMCGLEEKLKEKDSERRQMKSTYRDKITRLKQDALEKLSKRDQVISALRGQMETKMQATFIAEVSFRSEEIVVQRAMGVTERHYRKVETKLYAQICKTEELERGLEKRMRLQQEKENDWKNVENALRSKIKQLKQTVSLTDGYREKVMGTLPCHMKAQTDAQRQTDGMYEVVIMLNSHIKELCGKLEEQMSIHQVEKRDWKNVERALRDQIKQLKITIAVWESENQTVIRHPYQSH